MTLASFDDLLQSARQQPEPQRLLFVFAGAGVSDDATPEQRAAFEAGEGGELTPLMCVDKSPDELASFATLAEEARQAGPEWAIVFVAAMSGRAGRAPTTQEAEPYLRKMVQAIEAGMVGNFAPFDQQGRPVSLG